jgi:hypothetical protein
VTFWFFLYIAAACAGVVAAVYVVFDNIMSDFLAMCTIVVGIICGLAAFGLTVGFVASNLDRTECLQRGEKTGMDVQFELLSGCYVRVDGQLVPYDKWVQVSGVTS